MVFMGKKWEEYTEEMQQLQTKFNFGFIPVMLGSKLCVLNEMTETNLYNMGECRYDQGGYFIIDGKKRY